MTDLLKRLLQQLGMVYMSVSHLSIRPGTEFQSLEEYSQSLGDVEPDEPVLVVRVSKDGRTTVTHQPPNTKDFGDQYERGAITILDLPEAEFHFFKAFRPALFDLDKQLPAFVSQMSYVYSYELFEGYVGNVLRGLLAIHSATPEIRDSKLRRLMRQPIGMTLGALRVDFGLSQLAVADDKVVEISMIRNCLIHNDGIADSKLTSLSSSFSIGDRIEVSTETLARSINVLKASALAIDVELEKVISDFVRSAEGI